MAIPTFTMRQLLEAGVHFGHRSGRWNPRMGPYLYGVRNKVHIIDLRQTVPMLHRALIAVRDIVASGGRVLFVGTKRQASEAVTRAAERCGQYYVNHRWLGGMMTNWATISQSIKRLLAVEEQLAGEDTGLTKKELLKLTRERDKLERALGGIKDMGGLPDIIFVIDTNKEDIAIKEAQKLSVQCIKCHGLLEQKSGLELDTPAGVMKGGDEGEVVVPGKPEESRLYQYLDANSDPHMPPKKQLSDAERESVHAWITAMTIATEAASSPEKPLAFDSVTQVIDTFMAAGWQRRGIEPAAADERTWCRRVYLDLAGRIPTQGELEAFLFSPSDAKRINLVERLLVSDDYAVRMRELWDTLLMGRGKRKSHEERRKDNGWWAFLENAFRENRPWNETVRDFLSARPDTPEQKGATWFLYERRDRHQAIAEAVAPVVYGTRIECAQCHDHPLAREIKQGHY